jgi:hypothetical protein
MKRACFSGKEQKIFWQELKHPYLCNPLLKKSNSSSKKIAPNSTQVRLSIIFGQHKVSKKKLKKNKEKFGSKKKALTFAIRF